MWKVSVLVLCVFLGSSWGHQELYDVLKQQEEILHLSVAEVEALRPFYRELQTQYNYLYSLEMQNGDAAVQPQDTQLDYGYAKAFEEFRAQFGGSIADKPTIEYDTTLRTLDELIGPAPRDMSEQQLQEWQDLRAILQDVLDESQLGIDQLVKRATELEVNLLKLDKPKIVTAAIAGLETMWNYWGRASQAAYCSYSHVPQFSQVLQAINGGVDCYIYTKGLIQQIEDETVASVKEIKKNVQGLLNIYKKIAAKQTLMGKILSGTLNVLSALRRVHDIIAVGISGYDKVNNQLPDAVQHIAGCGQDFAEQVPYMIETAQNLTSCITYVNPEKKEYEFTKPEEDRYWNTGGEPEEIPHENEGIDDDDDDDDDTADDYVDHR